MPNEIYTFNHQKENLKSFLEVYELQSIVILHQCSNKHILIMQKITAEI